MTFDATVNPIAYENGEAVFIDTEYDTWNMDPVALEKAFEIYPDVRLVVLVHLYGTPAKVDEIREICKRHNALLIEDAAESFGASYKGKQTGNLGDYSAISFNGNKIITGSSGGMFLTDSQEDAEKVRKWSTQSREAAPWYQHEEIGYNYRMSNVIAGVVRGQMPYLAEHIAQKKAIYERYREGLKGLPVCMNPYDAKNSEPNFWLSCMIIDKDAMCKQVRGETEALYTHEKGKSSPHRNSRTHRRHERRRTPHLETHAHAAHVHEPRIHHRKRERPRPHQRLYRRQLHRRGSRHLCARAMPPERQQDDPGAAGRHHPDHPRMLRVVRL
jgi:Predicted pyridoxal phosphate-dependent enzyme apparently involved in regulation of cell wall biogenesis